MYKKYQIFSINEKNVEELIKLYGWIKTVRISKRIAFIDIYDGTCFKIFQIVAKDDHTKNFNLIKNINNEDAVSFFGIVKKNLKTQSLELLLDEYKVIAKCEKNTLQKKEQTFEFLRTIPELRNKTFFFQKIFRIKNFLYKWTLDFFYENNYVFINSPILTSNDSEGLGEIFNIDKKFFKSNVFLSVSSQLYLEAMAQSFSNVFTLSPTFRADKSNTTKHLAEFWMLEIEKAFSTQYDIIEIAENYFKYLARLILKNFKNELEFFSKKFNINLLSRCCDMIEKKFEIISYSKAIEILKKNSSKLENSNIVWGNDLLQEHEKFIVNYFNNSVFITNYPKDIKAFYMKLSNDKKTVNGFDLLLFGVGEVLGGSERENDFIKLKKSMENKSINFSNLEWYLNLRKHGYADSAGFGIGFERTVMYFFGIPNIRDVVAFPRSLNNFKI